MEHIDPQKRLNEKPKGKIYFPSYELVFNRETDPRRMDVVALAIREKQGVAYIARVYTSEGQFRGEEEDHLLPYVNVMRTMDIEKNGYILVDSENGHKRVY